MTDKKPTGAHTENEQRSEQKPGQRPYHSPRLSLFGSILSTAGGEGSKPEPNPGTGNQPPPKHP